MCVNVSVNIILSTPPQGFSGIILQHWLGDFAGPIEVQFTSNEGMSNDADIHECESEIDHYTRHYVYTCATPNEECVGSLTSHRFIHVQGLVRRGLRFIVLIREE